MERHSSRFRNEDWNKNFGGENENSNSETKKNAYQVYFQNYNKSRDKIDRIFYLQQHTLRACPHSPSFSEKMSSIILIANNI